MLVVTTTDSAAIMECYAAIKVLVAPTRAARCYTLVNLTPRTRTAADVHARIAEACRRVSGLARCGRRAHVPRCDAGARRTSRRWSFRRAGAAAQSAMDRAADTLWAQLQRNRARVPASRRRRLAQLRRIHGQSGLRSMQQRLNPKSRPIWSIL